MTEIPIPLKKKYLVRGGLRHGFKTPSSSGDSTRRHNRNKLGDQQKKLLPPMRLRVLVLTGTGRRVWRWL